MKRHISFIAATLVLGSLFFSCKFEKDDDDGGSKQSSEVSSYLNGKVSFDFSGAKAFAKLEPASSSGRAATDDELGDFVKILADGSMRNSITVADGGRLSEIRGVYKSPVESSNDVFVEFSGQSYLGYDEKNGISINLGQLVCFHDDGSVSDILKLDDSSNGYDRYMYLQQGSVQFDVNGNLYFIATSYNNTVYSDGSAGVSSDESVIYQFNPSTNEITEMVAAVGGTHYSKMQIDKNGQWIFVFGNRYSGSSTYFLRAIPISNPNNYVNVYYSSNSYYDIEWVYDDNSETIYYVASDGNKSGLFTATKAGGFKDKAFQRSNVDRGYKYYYSYGSESDRFVVNSYDNVNYTPNYSFNQDFYDNDVLDSSKLLEYIFSFCDVEGEKEFRLTGFLEDSDLSSLYNADLKDEEAIEWLASDSNRMYSLYSKVFGYGGDYSYFMNFLAKTCFIKGTDTKATTWSVGDYCIPYSGLKQLSANENGVFGIYTNTSNNWGSTESPYFYIVHVADSQGNLIENQRKLDLPTGKVTNSQINSGILILKYALMDSNGSELGYHHIYAVDFDSGSVTNCFENVPNRNNLEVVSFSSAGDLLYYCAIRGTSVENGVVNISTNEYNPLSVSRKMVSVYTFD